MANAADNFQFNADNVFDSWDLNPLAQQVGAGADGVRDTLASKRDEFLKPHYDAYRSGAAAGGYQAAADDASLFGDAGFQTFVKTGQAPARQQPQTVTQQWNQQPTPTPAPGAVTSQGTTSDARNQLFELLKSRATQALTVDPNDSTLRQQTDAYDAQMERDRRNYLADLAERSSPNANLTAETRLASERASQAKAGNKSALIGQVLQAKRDEVAQALQSMQGMLSADQQAELTMQLKAIDAALAEKGLGLQEKGLAQDWQKALLNNDEFMRQLGLQEWDRANYYDSLKSGYFG